MQSTTQIVILLQGIPNSLSTSSANQENIELQEKSIIKYAELHKTLGVSLIICQKLISPALKYHLKVTTNQQLGIETIEKIGLSASKSLSKITKKVPANSIYLIKSSDLVPLQISLKYKKFLIVHSESFISILHYSIIEEDHNYLCEIFRSSFKVIPKQVLYFYFFSKVIDQKISLNPKKISENHNLLLKKYVKNMPKGRILLDFLEISFDAILNFLRCSNLDISLL